MVTYKFDLMPEYISIRGNFDNSCKLTLSEECDIKLKNKQTSLQIYQHGYGESHADKIIKNIHIDMKSVSGKFIMFFANSDSSLKIGKNCKGLFDLRFWRESTIEIGDETTSNGTKIIVDNGLVKIGKDCMFSDGILIQAGDQHGIIDIQKKQITNNHKRIIIIGDHIWLGRNTTVLADIEIGNGSILGANSVTASNMDSKSIYVGNPAKKIKENHTWTRYKENFDNFSNSIISEDISSSDT